MIGIKYLFLNLTVLLLWYMFIKEMILNYKNDTVTPKLIVLWIMLAITTCIHAYFSFAVIVKSDIVGTWLFIVYSQFAALTSIIPLVRRCMYYTAESKTGVRDYDNKYRKDPEISFFNTMIVCLVYIISCIAYGGYWFNYFNGKVEGQHGNVLIGVLNLLLQGGLFYLLSRLIPTTCANVINNEMVYKDNLEDYKWLYVVPYIAIGLIIFIIILVKLYVGGEAA